MAPAAKTQQLSTIAPGGRVVVVGLHGAGSPVARRLADLGFLPGTEVSVVRRAPFRDPTVYELRGYQLCLRSREAALIDVSPVSTETSATVSS